ncbi:hypothetical protein AAFF_G00317290 [Aldrovandia affinis]|uniref:Uncharacterized protein n=1 Tax=Aldrovandia affinis TaxID=143900 RepID=A0AAD7W0V5_9TELE|nr:hypothetical protein AAFF_G00317290 [Aldrovandia affinis]
MLVFVQSSRSECLHGCCCCPPELDLRVQERVEVRGVGAGAERTVRLFQTLPAAESLRGPVTASLTQELLDSVACTNQCLALFPWVLGPHGRRHRHATVSDRRSLDTVPAAGCTAQALTHASLDPRRNLIWAVKEQLEAGSNLGTLASIHRDGVRPSSSAPTLMATRGRCYVGKSRKNQSRVIACLDQPSVLDYADTLLLYSMLKGERAVALRKRASAGPRSGRSAPGGLARQRSGLLSRETA